MVVAHPLAGIAGNTFDIHRIVGWTMGIETKRFLTKDRVVTDNHSGLMWPIDAAPGEFPMMWHEALAFVDDLNRRGFAGFTDWHLPNRRELFSLVSHERINPALPQGHPYVNVFAGYYWTSTTCSRLPDQAWYVHLGGARVFKGMKHGFYMVWPVRTEAPSVRQPCRTGQRTCYAENHVPRPCAGGGQDGDLLAGRPWPQARFVERQDGVLDRLTGLVWDRTACRSEQPVDWESACELVAAANRDRYCGHDAWRLPAVREIEGLCDLGAHSPALPAGHPFENVRSDYWTSTTSRYESRYAWVLYLQDGAVGVGFKSGAAFDLWLVRSRKKVLSLKS
jgi:hypothetical protein